MDTVELNHATVKGYRAGLRTTDNGTLLWNIQNIDRLPQILGNSDPIHYAHFLPGVQMNGEYKSGVHIQGCESSQNMIDLGGVPIYNVNHLLGLFSTFNTPHFSKMVLNTSPTKASDPNRIGGRLSMQPYDEPPQQTTGEVTLGLISSQGTLRTPVGKKVSLAVSARASYFNLIYGHWLIMGETELNYRFFDTNATLAIRPDSLNTITLNAYAGQDVGHMDEPYYVAAMKARWGNTMGSLTWHLRKHRYSMHQTLYTTAYANRFSMAMQEQTYRLPSNITTLGYAGRLALPRWQTGLDIAYHAVQRQKMEQEGEMHLAPNGTPMQRATEATAWADYTQPLSPHFSLALGLRLNAYRNGDFSHWGADPSCALHYNTETLSATAAYTLRHQYLHQAGFSDAGLPTEYWMAADGKQPPQYAHAVSLKATMPLWQNRYRITAEVFFKRLFHQVEYAGSILDLANTVYDADASLIHGRGWNSGVSIMIQKTSGRLNGWAAYTFIRARRTFDEYGGAHSFPANHERPHELNIVASWLLNDHFSFGATIVVASGTPFTAPRSVAFINGNLVVEYGPHNANRLHTYFKTDVSANYRWRGRFGKEQGVNLSLYNVTCHENELFYSLRTHKDGMFAYRPSTFFVRILPSLSYYLKF